MPQKPEDPVLVSARREAWMVFFTWLTAMTWSVSYCYFNGYLSDLGKISDKSAVKVVEGPNKDSPKELWVDTGNGLKRIKFVLGFPDWIFYGVIGPWWLCSVLSILFGAYIVRDEDLGAETETSWEIPTETISEGHNMPSATETQKGAKQ